ncbi:MULTISPECIES: lipoprotein-releasing ABC transporter ATP-binding protein LolD [Legionella]|uniref:Lipoprotein-releasing system ATP-binding protein LolD n=1 Tax=Legionella septentrionalis TaxID=2498109 RepID=A0A433JKQ9_9GAMM|nr:MULTISPECIES: lipoprotein-releasing ABC transporter ATP-binding protein LolD [Legionella]MCP0914447.1 lipoprotein-releasing ABC transporter ATP-binding protein LolD [Legionella sp. 27cVA30]RUQ89489.1 lipoprotein-releasing ABC transporter ATP-binding protein LolD [Legionella septentrionalis]RUQ97329.1 lipoprotein-releasing ABC transporter ATP-binding protein LolD [Legionella septentrionalis]RUR10501.1 lipoprotein-releasing ABC transporter ATP-binding protein LolD [Legionella septentrionalis]
MNKMIVCSSNLGKTYRDGQVSVAVLQDVNFSVEKGARIAIVGPSGSGKSTLLHLLGGLDKPSGGQVSIEGVDWQSLSEKQRCQTRNKNLGFIYQFHHLLPEFTALENVAMPLLLAGEPTEKARAQARMILAEVGLAAREQHKPSQLSGGERQRVAIARALVHKPQCVFADEPTGNLDHATALKVFDLMLDLNQRLHTALVIVTHDMELAKRMDKILTLQEGQLLQLND